MELVIVSANKWGGLWSALGSTPLSQLCS